MLKSDPSTEPNRPHISSDTSDVKERRDKTDRGAVSSSARPPVLSARCLRLLALPPSSSRTGASPLRFGEGLFTEPRRRPQGVFCGPVTFFLRNRFSLRNMGVTASAPTTRRQLEPPPTRENLRFAPPIRRFSPRLAVNSSGIQWIRPVRPAPGSASARVAGPGAPWRPPRRQSVRAASPSRAIYSG